MLSRFRLFVTPWTVTRQAPLSMEFSWQEYWSGLPYPPPDLPNPGIKPVSPALQANFLPSEPPGKPYGHQPVTHWLCFLAPKSIEFCNIYSHFI